MGNQFSSRHNHLHARCQTNVESSWVNRDSEGRLPGTTLCALISTCCSADGQTAGGKTGAEKHVGKTEWRRSFPFAQGSKSFLWGRSDFGWLGHLTCWPKCSSFSLQLVIYSALGTLHVFFRPERYEGIGKIKKCQITEHKERRPRSEEDQVGGSKKQSQGTQRASGKKMEILIFLSIA